MDYLISSASLLALDSAYISLTRPYFSGLVKNIQKQSMSIRMFAVIAVYVLLTFGLYVLIISKRRSPQEAFYLGLVIYGVFEFTNYALFKDWSVLPVMFDTLWGGVLLYLATRITYMLTRK